MRCLLLIFALSLAFIASAFAQSAPLQGGGWTVGHVPFYGGGTVQPVIIDGGAARGGDVGVGIAELLLQARGTGTPPYDGQGTGPYGTISCMNDAPITNAGGYHFLCFSPNSGAAGLIAYGAAGIAAAQPLKFNINGTLIVGADCSGSPTSSFATVNGIVTHC